MNAVPGTDSLTFNPVLSSNCNFVNCLLYVLPSTSEPVIWNGTFVKPDALPLNADAVIEPTKCKEPVLTVFVEINSSTDGPREPDLAI